MGKMYVWCNEQYTKLRKSLNGDVNIDSSVYIADMLHHSSIGPNDLIVCIGDETIDQLRQHKILPKKWVLSTLRKHSYMYNNTPLFLMDSPENGYKNYKTKVELLCDIKDLQRFKQHGYLFQPFENYEWVDNFDEFFADVDVNSGNNIIALDTETTGRLFDNKKSLMCISFSWKENCSRAIYTKHGLSEKARIQLQDILQLPYIKPVCANGKYDLQWIKQVFGVHCTNYNFDTLLGGTLVDENRSNSLSTHARVYTEYSGYDKAFNETYDKEHMDTVPLDALLYYACGDAQVCYLTRGKIVQELQQTHKNVQLYKSNYGKQYPYWNMVHGSPLSVYKKIVHPASRTFETIETNGVYVDVEQMKHLQEQLQEEINHTKKEIAQYVPQKILEKYIDNDSPTRSKFLVEYLYEYLQIAPQDFTEKTGKPTTAIKKLFELEKVAPDHVKPFFPLLQKYSKLCKTKSTFVDGFLTHLCDDNKFHPIYFLFKGMDDFGLDGGTLSGRTSTKSPSFHTVPKSTPDAKRLRQCYTAPPGYKIIQGDFSQIELRLVSYVSQDPVMLESFNNGLDLHKLTAARALGLTIDQFSELDPDKQKYYRQIGKTCYTGTTEVLTRNGWVQLNQLVIGEEILQYDPVTTQLQFVLPQNYYSGIDFVKRYHDRNNCLEITDNHTQILLNKRKEIVSKPIKDFKPYQLNEWYSINAGIYCNNDTKTLDDALMKFIVMVQADGSINKYGSIRLGFSKKRKIEKCEKILTSLNVIFHKHLNKNGVVTFYISKKDVPQELFSFLWNKQFTFELLWKLNLISFLYEIAEWDSHKYPNSKNLVVYTSKHKINVEVVQTAAILSGIKASICFDGRYWKCKYRLQTNSISRISWEKNGVLDLGTQQVYCVQVPSGYLITRNNGKVSISGNCNFGLVYKMWINGYMQYAKMNYGIPLTFDQAKQYYESYHGTYKNIGTMHQMYINFARKFGFSISPIGRVHNLPFINSENKELRAQAERLSINRPIQGLASDLMLLLLHTITQQFPMVKIFGTVHDSFLVYAPEGQCETLALEIKNVAEHLPLQQLFNFNLLDILPIVVDIETGYNLGELQPLT